MIWQLGSAIFATPSLPARQAWMVILSDIQLLSFLAHKEPPFDGKKGENIIFEKVLRLLCHLIIMLLILAKPAR
jgi:hypothetical protein